MNERSLEDYGDLAGSLSLFLNAARELSSVGATLFKDSRFFATPDFQRRFNKLSLAKDQRALIRELAFGSRYFKCWTPERVSADTERYSCADPKLELVDESICEAAERKLGGVTEPITVLSASESVFKNSGSLNVSKVSTGQTTQLDNVSSLVVVRHWIISSRGHYDFGFNAPPHDFQTILVKEPGRFRPTGRVERHFSRRIFEEIATNRLYYVDHGHPGPSAHLEVFSANYEHLGVADINSAELDTKARVNGRTLRL